tara:strand:- start:1570 stop:2475 length:906 start_codon:yes stop_codon:yes gene_type:complete
MIGNLTRAAVFLCLMLGFSGASNAGLPTETVAYPVLVQMDFDGGQGSGFFVLHSDSVYLVTARHVVLNREGKFWSPSMRLSAFGLQERGVQPSKLTIDLQALSKAGECRFHETWDAAILRIGIANGNEKQRPITYLPSVTLREGGRLTVVDWKNLTRLEGLRFGARVYVSGFPNSVGLPDGSQLDQRFPLLREGIIAGIHPEYSNVILDCRVDGGNSGGPVIWRTEDESGNELYSVMGLVSQYVPVAQNWIDSQNRSVNQDVANSGYSVVTPMDAVIELLEKTEVRNENSSHTSAVQANTY